VKGARESSGGILHCLVLCEWDFTPVLLTDNFEDILIHTVLHRWPKVRSPVAYLGTCRHSAMSFDVLMFVVDSTIRFIAESLHKPKHETRRNSVCRSLTSFTTSMPLPASRVSLLCHSCNASDFTLEQYTTEHTDTANAHPSNHLRARIDRRHDPMGSLPAQPRT
jgi:hypothetical protein